MREAVKATMRAVAAVLVTPRILSYRIWARVLGADRALEGATERLARIPGLRGQYLRRAFLARTIRGCHPTATVCYGTVFSRADAVIDEGVYIGPGCHLGLVHLERNVLLAAGVHVPSGPATHGTERTDIPIRDQPGRPARVRIGAGTWIGSAAIVMADVGCDAVIGAGSVVAKPVPDRVVAAGVPAIVRRRRSAAGDEMPAIPRMALVD